MVTPLWSDATSWQLLNANAGAIQAIAAVVATTVTGVLAYITWIYVRLTSRLADAAATQIQFHRAIESAGLRELQMMLLAANLILSSLPRNADQADRIMRRSLGWEALDLARFQFLAMTLGSHEAATASSGAISLGWLRDRCGAIKATNHTVGYNWSAFPWPEYLWHLNVATECLTSTTGSIKRRLAARESSNRNPEHVDAF